MSEHTPVPWKAEIRQNSICILSGDKSIAVMCIMPDIDHLYKPIIVEANAELIVRACNSHEDLVNLCVLSLGALVAIFVPEGTEVGDFVKIEQPYAGLIEKLEAAITKAKENQT